MYWAVSTSSHYVLGTQHHFCALPATSVLPQSKHIGGTFYEINGLYSSKMAMSQITKKNCSRLKEPKKDDKWMRYLQCFWISFAIKVITFTIDTLIRSVDYCSNIMFLILQTVLRLCKGIHCAPHRESNTHGLVICIKCADSQFSTKYLINTEKNITGNLLPQKGPTGGGGF